MINPLSLEGKHIVITGASAGIGRAACVQASKLGARVSLVARNEQRLHETISLMEGNGHEVYSFDLGKIEQIEGLMTNIVEKDGPIDGLVHCAGIGYNRPIKQSTPSCVEELARIHYFAFVELVRASSSKRISNNGASFLGITSIAAAAGDKTQGMYSGAKGAMNAVVHPFAKELSNRRIRINTLGFGMVETDMYKGFLDMGCDNEWLLQKQYLGIIPPEYAGNAICFMLSDISKYITGETIYYDAGALS